MDYTEAKGTLNYACEDDRWDLVDYSLDTTVVFYTGIKEIVTLTF